MGYFVTLRLNRKLTVKTKCLKVSIIYACLCIYTYVAISTLQIVIKQEPLKKKESNRQRKLGKPKTSMSGMGKTHNLVFFGDSTNMELMIKKIVSISKCSPKFYLEIHLATSFLR